MTLTVTKVTPSINWSNPADIAAGTPLGPSQLNATATYPGGLPPAATGVEGTFTYTPPAGTVLPQGNNQTLSVQFTPSVPANFNSASGHVVINVIAPSALALASAAGGVSALAPGSLASAFGAGLAAGQPASASLPWPTTLDGTSVRIVDSTGASTPALMTYASSAQVNFQIPDGVATGAATITVAASGGASYSARVNLTAFAPALFTLNPANLAAAGIDCVSSSGAQTPGNVYQVVNGAVVPLPVNLAACAETVLELYGTGLDQATASGVQVTIGGAAGSVLYAGPQGAWPGLDQINVVIPASLAGSGNVPVVLTTAGMTSNTVNLTFQ